MKNHLRLLLIMIQFLFLYTYAYANELTEDTGALLESYRNQEIALELPFDNSWFFYVDANGEKGGLFPEFAQMLEDEHGLRVSILPNNAGHSTEYDETIRFATDSDINGTYFVHYQIGTTIRNFSMAEGRALTIDHVGILNMDGTAMDNQRLQKGLSQFGDADLFTYQAIEPLVADLHSGRLDIVILPSGYCSLTFLEQNDLYILTGEAYTDIMAGYTFHGNEELCGLFHSLFLDFLQKTEAAEDYRLHLLGLSLQEIRELKTTGINLIYEDYPAVQYINVGEHDGLLFSILDMIQHNAGLRYNVAHTPSMLGESSDGYDLLARVEVVSNQTAYFSTQNIPLQTNGEFSKYRIYVIPLYEVMSKKDDLIANGDNKTYTIGYTDDMKSLLNNSHLSKNDEFAFLYTENRYDLKQLLETGAADAVLECGIDIGDYDISSYNGSFDRTVLMECGLFFYVRRDSLTEKFFDLYFSERNYIYPWFDSTRLNYMFTRQLDKYQLSLRVEEIRRKDTDTFLTVTVFVVIFILIVIFLVLIIKRSREKGKENMRIKEMADRDELTGAFNLRRYNRDIGKRIQKGEPFALIQFDIDHFKDVNDTYGHETGDLVIKSVVSKMHDSIRKEDALYRKGGDEFVLIVNSVDRVTVQSIIDRFKNKFSSFDFVTDDGETLTLMLGASFGIALYPDDGQDKDNLFKNSDTALYVSKNTGRNRFTFYAREA